jgi:hypothetical protein
LKATVALAVGLVDIDGGFDRRNAMVEKLVEKLWCGYGVAMMFDEILQRAACNMNSSFRAFTRHCPCGLCPHGLCCNQKRKTKIEER